MQSAPASILIVDDDARNTLALEALLQPLGARLSVARTGHEALHRLREHRYDVLLLDVRLPDMSGFEVARLAGDTGETTILYLSAQDDPRGAAHADDYFHKPLDAENLLARLDRILSMRGAAR
jgi:DNA-binding response OmpR family regulator